MHSFTSFKECFSNKVFLEVKKGLFIFVILYFLLFIFLFICVGDFE